ncbi:hypothetical protein KCP70_00935 [Salmonella enterica subsp. enterica]|nr:hypothetical protein KCP70_00935 [Salmonella enterica subsp. enterica]
MGRLTPQQYQPSTSTNSIESKQLLGRLSLATSHHPQRHQYAGDHRVDNQKDENRKTDLKRRL